MKNKNTSIPQSGFTLIEVLVALLVLSIGLLGLAALQATSLKANHGAYNRGQAMFLAYDVMDRMRANRNQALGGQYNIAFGTNPPGAGAGAPLAQQDLDDWLTNVQNLLPAGTASINCFQGTIPNIADCTIIMQWDETRIGGSASDGNLTQFTYTSQI